MNPYSQIKQKATDTEELIRATIPGPNGLQQVRIVSGLVSNQVTSWSKLRWKQVYEIQCKVSRYGWGTFSQYNAPSSRRAVNQFLMMVKGLRDGKVTLISNNHENVSS